MARKFLLSAAILSLVLATAPVASRAPHAIAVAAERRGDPKRRPRSQRRAEPLVAALVAAERRQDRAVARIAGAKRDPAVDRERGGHVDVVTRDPGGGLSHLVWNGSAWSSWTSLGGTVASSPAIFRWTST